MVQHEYSIPCVRLFTHKTGPRGYLWNASALCALASAACLGARAALTSALAMSCGSSGPLYVLHSQQSRVGSACRRCRQPASRYRCSGSRQMGHSLPGAGSSSFPSRARALLRCSCCLEPGNRGGRFGINTQPRARPYAPNPPPGLTA